MAPKLTERQRRIASQEEELRLAIDSHTDLCGKIDHLVKELTAVQAMAEKLDQGFRKSSFGMARLDRRLGTAIIAKVLFVARQQLIRTTAASRRASVTNREALLEVIRAPESIFELSFRDLNI